MNKYLTLTLIFGLLPYSNCSSQEEEPIPKTTEEVLKNLPGSDLNSLLKGIGEERDSLSVVALTSLLKNHREKMFGEISDIRKFYTLKDLSEIISKHPERSKLSGLIMDQVVLTKPWTKKAKGWDQLSLESKGGSVGLLIDCLLNIATKKEVIQSFNLIVQSEDPNKTRIFLDRIRLKDDPYDFLEVVENKRAKTTSLELNTVLDKYIKEAKEREKLKEEEEAKQ